MTAQAPDKILFKGKEYSLETNPMELYFSKHPETRPSSRVDSTALWRGYVATFEVMSKNLVLKDITIPTYTETGSGQPTTTSKSVKDTLIPNGEVLQVDWFTGILVLPYGELVNYVHMGYGSTYSNYILLEIESGKLTGEKKLNHKQYEQFKESSFRHSRKRKNTPSMYPV